LYRKKVDDDDGLFGAKHGLALAETLESLCMCVCSTALFGLNHRSRFIEKQQNFAEQSLELFILRDITSHVCQLTN
jgi:hypothetical protein